MSPQPGSLHYRPRTDSGAVRLVQWARSRRRPWTADEASDALGVSPRRMRGHVTALHAAGYLDQMTPADRDSTGRMSPAAWALSAWGRDAPPPIVEINGEAPSIRPGAAEGDGPGNVRLRKAREASGLSTRALAHAVGVHHSTLRRMLSGQIYLEADDPVIARAAAARRRS